MFIICRQRSSQEMTSIHCKTPEPSPTFEKTELAESSTKKYQYNVQTLKNELDRVIKENKNGKIDNNNYFTQF